MDRNAHILPSYQFSLNRKIWFALAGLAALTGVWIIAEGVTLDISKAYVFFYIYALFIALSLIYRYIRPDDTLYLLGHIANQWISAAAVLGVLSYVSARANFPLTDETLIAIDHALFFDWREFVHWVDGYPWIAFLFSSTYITSGPQMMILVALLFLYKQTAHIQRFVIAFLMTGMITILFATLFPAVGGYVYYNIDVAQFTNLEPVAARIHEAPLLAMRDHSVSVLAFPLQGLVTFPSFHSALSLVLIYACWPVRWLRWIVVPLNIIVWFSTPTDGGHYLIDILGGVAIAAYSIFIIEKKFKPPGEKPIWEATR